MQRRKHAKPPLIMRMPKGLREQPAWVFIGVMIALVGLSYATGFSESVIARSLGPIWQEVWGGLLLLAGTLLGWATILAKPALEKLALRAFSCTLGVYTGWLLSVTSVRRATLTVVMAVLLIGLAEIRVRLLSAVMGNAERVAEELRRTGVDTRD